jgi:ParB-like chromosome segregation protein Spo0J
MRRWSPAMLLALLWAAPAPAAGLLRTRFLDPRDIDVQEGWNARIDMGDLEELGRQILAQKRLDGHGLLNDIRVKEKADGRFALIDGERRWLSVMGLIDAGEEFEFGIPAKVEPADATDRDLIIKMFLANEGKRFLPYEEALYYKRLQDSGMTLAQIEEATGRSDNSIVGALALLQADDDLQDAVIKGTIGATMAKSIAVNVRGNKARQRELVAAAKHAKKSGDRAKMAKVRKDVDDERRAKAAKTAPNLKLKARKAEESEIAALGQEVGANLVKLMTALGLPHETDMRAWLAADTELQIAATFGALTALRRVMGVMDEVNF